MIKIMIIIIIFCFFYIIQAYWWYLKGKRMQKHFISIRKLEQFYKEKECAKGLGKETKGFMLGRDCILKDLKQLIKNQVAKK